MENCKCNNYLWHSKEKKYDYYYIILRSVLLSIIKVLLLNSNRQEYGKIFRNNYNNRVFDAYFLIASVIYKECAEEGVKVPFSTSQIMSGILIFQKWTEATHVLSNMECHLFCLTDERIPLFYFYINLTFTMITHIEKSLFYIYMKSMSFQ